MAKIKLTKTELKAQTDALKGGVPCRLDNTGI